MEPPPVRPVRIEYPESPRLQRVRRMAQLLDQSIVLPGGYRIGLDPIIGLIPGIGDVIGTTFSFYLIYEAARLGIPKRILLRMGGNVLLEFMAGSIPILGDIFDAVWKANMRNLRLIELHHHPARPERPARKILWTIGMLFVSVIAIGVTAFIGILRLLVKLFQVGS